MAIHKKKVLFITTGVITLVVFAGIFALMLNIEGFKPQIETIASNALGMDGRITGKADQTGTCGHYGRGAFKTQ